jgi:hypothetical protein
MTTPIRHNRASSIAQVGDWTWSSAPTLDRRRHIARRSRELRRLLLDRRLAREVRTAEVRVTGHGAPPTFEA